MKLILIMVYYISNILSSYTLNKALSLIGQHFVEDWASKFMNFLL